MIELFICYLSCSIATTVFLLTLIYKEVKATQFETTLSFHVAVITGMTGLALVSTIPLVCVMFTNEFSERLSEKVRASLVAHN